MRKTPLKHTANPLRFLTVAALLFIYAGVCGFSASVVRAMVICLISYLGRLLWVKTDFLQSLGAAAIIILLFTPSALFEVGFQLSFAACLGLALLTKPIGQVCDHVYKLYRKAVPIKRTEEQLAILSTGDTLPPTIGERVYRTAASFFSATTAAQIATAPLLLHYFGYLSGWATLLNCLFVPLISALFSALLVFVVLASILPAICASVVLFLPNAVWSALLLLFQAVDFSSFALSGLMLSAGACVCYYAACVFSTDKWNLDTKLKYILSVTSILGFVATMVVLNV
jgi:competence protein ComEC